MALFKRKPKRLPPDEWPLPLVAQQVAVAYMTDAEGDEPRGAVIFHADPDLLPEDWEETVRRDVEEEGGTFEGNAEWIVFKMEFVEDDRVGLFMDGDLTAVIRGTWGAKSPEEADAEAQAWIDESGQEGFRAPLNALPNVFQYAFMAAATGREIEETAAYFLWAPELRSDAQAVAFRQFPKDPHAHPEKGKWSLMPPGAIEEMLAERGW